ncbi:MAG TPA: trigger factor [Actinomycetota bacterium]
MQTTVEEADKHVVRLQVEVPPEEFAQDLDQTYRKLAQDVRIPGFRKGKVPRQIIDARVGREHVMHQFVDEFLPTYYVRALREHDLAPIADPEIDLDQLEAGQSLKFTATVEVRPRLTLEPEQYKGVHVDAPDPEPRELEIDEYIDHLRERFAELEVVERPAQKGDYVLSDVRASVHGKEVPEASRVGFLTEVGSEELVPELDRELEGKRKGEILKFNAVLPESFGELAGQEVTFTVLLKEVKSKRLPTADDEFAKTASEFDTLEALREDVRTKLRAFKEAESKAAVRDLVLRQVVDSVDVDLPERLIDEETEHRIESAKERAERAGTTLEALLESQGWDELQFRSDARSHAIRALKAELVLEAVARQEGIKATKEDLEVEIRSLAETTGKDAREVTRILERSGQVGSLAGDIIRTKALDLLVEAADVSTGGAPAPSEAGPSQDQEGEHD